MRWHHATLACGVLAAQCGGSIFPSAEGVAGGNGGNSSGGSNHGLEAVTGFIARDRGRLVDTSPGADSTQAWRFAGFNAYWLGLDENCEPPRTGNCQTYPSKFRIDDALETAVGLGANVIRAHTLGISTGNNMSFQQHAGSAAFNDAALDAVDYALSRGAALGLRFIVPLTDSYTYYSGGYHDFVDYQMSLDPSLNASKCAPFPKRVVQPNDTCRAFFDHNPAATFGLGDATIQGFKTYISALANHKNRYSGTLLKDDPAILAWETGNELFIKGAPFYNWTAEIATFMKQTVGVKQLILDGRNEVGAGVDTAALKFEPDVDMYTDHYYESFASATGKLSKDAATTAVDSGKVFVVGEYGPAGAASAADLRAFTSAIETLQGVDKETSVTFPLVAGDTWWSFFGHGDNYGFVPHSDSYTMHFPGDTPEEQDILMLLRAHAFAMRSPSPSPGPMPPSPSAKPSPAPSAKPSPSPSPATCTDTQPPGDHNTCAAEAALGKCDRGWMQGYCCKTCFKCAAGCGKAAGAADGDDGDGDDGDTGRSDARGDGGRAVGGSAAVPPDTPTPVMAPVVNGYACLNGTNSTPPTPNCTDAVFWRGATLAVAYDVAVTRTPADAGSWVTLCAGCATDHDVPLRLNATDVPGGTICGGGGGTGGGDDDDLAPLVLRARGLSLAGSPGPWSAVVDLCALPSPLHDGATGGGNGNSGRVGDADAAVWPGMVARPLF